MFTSWNNVIKRNRDSEIASPDISANENPILFFVLFPENWLAVTTYSNVRTRINHVIIHYA